MTAFPDRAERIVDRLAHVLARGVKVGIVRDELAVYETAEAALREIKSEQGQVCDMYEICEHRACQSSYSAWAIADKALRQIDGDA